MAILSFPRSVQEQICLNYRGLIFAASVVQPSVPAIASHAEYLTTEPPFTCGESFKSNISMVVRRNTGQLRDFVMVLSVQGPSETGDLHKTSQCCDIRNGLRTRSLTCLCGSPYLVVLNGFSGRDRVSHQDRHRDKSHQGRGTKIHQRLNAGEWSRVCVMWNNNVSPPYRVSKTSMIVTYFPLPCSARVSNARRFLCQFQASFIYLRVDPTDCHPSRHSYK